MPFFYFRHYVSSLCDKHLLQGSARREHVRGTKIPARPTLSREALLFFAMKLFDYNTSAWKAKRNKILRRDGYMCQECRRYGRIREATEVHHIKHADEYPELAYVDSNLVSLCHACHQGQHPEKAKAMNRNHGCKY